MCGVQAYPNHYKKVETACGKRPSLSVIILNDTKLSNLILGTTFGLKLLASPEMLD
jgi:hypothetical protein